jgi:hypothetical protein
MVLLGKRITGRRLPGLLAGALTAVAPFLIHYEQVARSYALLVLLVTLSSYFFVAEIQQPGRGHRIGYVLSSSLAVYAHYFAVLVLLTQWITILVMYRRGGAIRAWLGIAAAVISLCVPEVIFASRAGTAGIDWIGVPGWQALTNLPTTMVGGRAAALALVLLAGYGFVRLLVQQNWGAGFLAAWLVLPVIITFIVSRLGRPLFEPYYLIIILPPLLLLAAIGVMELPSRIPILAALLVGALLVNDLHLMYHQPSPQDFRGLTQFMLNHERSGDVVVYDPTYAATGTDYYEALAHRTGPAVSSLLALPPQASRVWLVIRNSDVPPPERSADEGRLARFYDAAPLVKQYYGLTLALVTAG